jgi:hypothetical protein
MRSLSRMTLVVAMATLAAGALSTGCNTRLETANFVTQPYWQKSYFDENQKWYMRSTVVDAPANHGWVSIADGDWLMLEKLRWEITENELIGWRTYSTTPGSEAEQFAGADTFYKGQAVARFAITDHFDIMREFDATSGQQGNVIRENRDRQWYDREFIRVDWNRNMVQTTKGHLVLGDPYGFPIGNMDNDTHMFGPDRPGDPKRFRFEPDYFEVTTRTQVVPDLFAYFQLYGAQWAGDSSGALIDVRHSFMHVAESDYEPLPMPPSVVLEDENGDEVRDENGFRVTVPVNDRFGYFGALGRTTFDANRGMIQSGQIFNASRFNIWEKNRDESGALIPTELRTPKAGAIHYYANVEHPLQLMDASRAVAAQWNQAFRETVWKVAPSRYTGAPDATGIPSDVPDIFVFTPNSCNYDAVAKAVGALDDTLQAQIVDAAKRTTVNNDVIAFDGTLASIKTRLDEATAGINSYSCSSADQKSFTEYQIGETQALNDLERVCAALEYYTSDDITTGYKKPEGVTPFHYERLGDNRYSMFDLLASDFQSGWLGLGPPYSDPQSGETISATANVAVSGLDSSAARAAQVVSIMNGEETLDELAFGGKIRDYFIEKMAKSTKLVTRGDTQGLRERMDNRFDALREAGGIESMLRETTPGRAQQQMARVAGTAFEQKLITEADVQLFGGVAPTLSGSANMDEALMDAVSPVRSRNAINSQKQIEQKVIRMGLRAMDPPEMLDNLVIGLAINYKDMSCGERFLRLRQDIYKAVMLHEVGHNTGLFHNFAGSSDALNFGQFFWDVQNLSPVLATARAALATQTDEASNARVAQLDRCIDAVDANLAGAGDSVDDRIEDLTTQECLRQSEGMYSSIMDYHANWNSDVNGLGPYDFAATKFAYGQLVEVFPTENLAANMQNAGIQKMKDNIFYNDWREIPDMFSGSDGAAKIGAMHDRDYVKIDWNTSSTRSPQLANEVPYRFGYGAYPEPTVKVFDFGPDTQTNATFQLIRYYEHFFFSHFSRNRLLDYQDAVRLALNSDLGVIDDFTEKMQWYYFYKTTDPRFAGSYAETDFLNTTRTGLNLMSNIIGEPSSGTFLSVPKYLTFGITNADQSQYQNAPSDILFPSTNFSACNIETFNAGSGGVIAAPDPGYATAKVPLSQGRPFFLGFKDDYEDFYVTHIGDYWTKQEVLTSLGLNQAFFPRVDGVNDWRTFDVSWYRLFPKEVGSILSKLVGQNAVELGPVVDAAGKVTYRNLLNDDGTAPDYSGQKRIFPQTAANHEYWSLLIANALMSSDTDDTVDLAKSMRVALFGGEDDMSAYEDALAADVAAGCTPDQANFDDCATVGTFTHPVTGLTYRALKIGDEPAGFNLIKRLNVLKDRFVTLNGCLDETVATGTAVNPYCSCIVPDFDANNDCINVTLAPGTPPTARRFGCLEQDVRDRAQGARESLDDLVDYINDLRSLGEAFGT